MSLACFLFTGRVPPEMVPVALESDWQGSDLLEFAHNAGEFLSGYSPGHWLPGAVYDITQKLSIQGLEFLHCEPWETGNSCTFLFRSTQIDRIISAIDVVLERTNSCPEDVVNALNHQSDIYDAFEIREALDHTVASMSPEGDDGEGPMYLFAYLKSFRQLCLDTLVKGGAVVHVQRC